MNGVKPVNPIRNETLRRANEEAIYNLYVYLADKTTPEKNETLQSIVRGLESAFRSRKPLEWKDRDIYRLHILKNAVNNNAVLASSRIGNLTRSRSGLTACTFTRPDGNISVVFRGTGKGEWIDNGEGLSGIPEENTYITYGRNGRVIYRQKITKDHASDQQVEALNWFHSIAAKNGWNRLTPITLSGHSKGGNKAQFIAIHSDLVKECYSFDGQGFSPEALAALKTKYGEAYEMRRQNIRSFAADNDYISVLGERLVPEDQIYYFESQAGFHHPEAILDSSGRFRPQCEQGRLSKYVESVSDELMRLDPLIRRYAALGIMNILQRYLGEGVPVNGDAVSVEETIAGIGVALPTILRHLRSSENK